MKKVMLIGLVFVNLAYADTYSDTLFGVTEVKTQEMYDIEREKRAEKREIRRRNALSSDERKIEDYYKEKRIQDRLKYIEEEKEREREYEESKNSTWGKVKGYFN